MGWREFKIRSMNKSDLVEVLSRETRLTLYMAEEVVNTVFNDMADALVKGDRVEIRRQ